MRRTCASLYSRLLRARSLRQPCVLRCTVCSSSFPRCVEVGSQVIALAVQFDASLKFATRRPANAWWVLGLLALLRRMDRSVRRRRQRSWHIQRQRPPRLPLWHCPCTCRAQSVDVSAQRVVIRDISLIHAIRITLGLLRESPSGLFSWIRNLQGGFGEMERRE